MRTLFTLTIFAVISIASFGQGLEDRIHDILHEKLAESKWHPEVKSEIGTRNGEEYKMTTSTTATSQEGEPMIVVNPEDPDHVIVSFMSFQGGSLEMVTYLSFDGGATWELSDLDTDAIYGNDPERRGWPVAGGGDPMMAFTPDGKLYYTWIYLGLEGFQTGRWFNFWAVSDDGGRTFTTSSESEVLNFGALNLFNSQISDIGDGIFDRHWLAVDHSGGPFDGSIYMAGLFVPNDVTSFDGPGIVVKRKRAQEARFEEEHTAVYRGGNAQFAQIEVDDEGAVHVMYGDLDRSQLVHHISRDGGVTFTPAREVGPILFRSAGSRLIHDRENPAPSLVVDSKIGRIHAAWTYLDPRPEVLYSYSDNDGFSWSTPKNLAEYTNGDYAGGHMVSLGLGPNGEVSAFFFAQNGQDGDYVHMVSRDGGESFSGYDVISGESTDFSAYSRNSPLNETFFGDYFASDFGQCHAYGVFSDGRLGQGPKVYFAKVDVCTGVGNEDMVFFEDDRFRINPNPGIIGSDLKLEFSGQDFISGDLKWIDSRGQMVLKQRIQLNDSGETMVRAPGTPGMYVAQLSNGRFTWVRRVLVR